MALGMKSGMESGSERGSMVSMSTSTKDSASGRGDMMGGHLRRPSSSGPELSSSSEQVALSGTLFVPPRRKPCLDARFFRVGPIWLLLEEVS